MRLPWFSLLILTSLVFPNVLHGQDKPKGMAEFNEFVDKPLDGWNWDDDERLADLILQLREKESSLEALDARIAKATGRKAGAKMDQNIAWRNNNRMDLNGGGPIRWDAFYGRNAEKFFYHPVDPNTTYHTETLLRQVQPTAAGGVPGNQGTPAHQRPPQFDYIYRGWDAEQQRAREKAEEIKDQVDRMVSQRRDLEKDVVLLWCKLAFRILDKEKFAEQPLLRWAATPRDENNAEDVERAAVLTTATQLLATALVFNDTFVADDADKACGTVDKVINKSRKRFEDGLLKSKVLRKEAQSRDTPLGKFKLLARRLEDASKTLAEGYSGWKRGDETDDEPAKYLSLRRVQDSVVTYAQLLLSLNELVNLMQVNWETDFNTDSTEFVPAWDVVIASTSQRSPQGSNGSQEAPSDLGTKKDSKPKEGATKKPKRLLPLPADKTVAKWSLVIADQESFNASWDRGSDGGTQSYDEGPNIISLDQPYWGHQGPFVYGTLRSDGKWKGFYCEVLAKNLNKQSFELYLNEKQFSLGEFVAKSPRGAAIKVIYDPKRSRADVFVNNSNRGFVEVPDEEWNQGLICSFKATGYQSGKVFFGNFRMLMIDE